MDIHNSNLSNELEALQKKIISLDVERGIFQESAKRLNETKQIIEVILNGISDAVFLMDKDFRIVWANKKVLDLAGYTMEEVVGAFCYKITHNRDSKCCPPDDVCPVDQAIKTGMPVVLKHTHHNNTGEEKIVEVTASPIKDDAGQITHYVHITRDITVQSLKERNLSSEEEKYRSLFNEMDYAILVCDVRTHVVLWVNSKAAELFGYVFFDHIVGKKFEEVLAGDNAYFKNKAQLLINKILVKNAGAFEWIARKKDGREIPIEADVRLSVIGGVQLLLAVIRDPEDFKLKKISLEDGNSSGVGI